MLGHVADRSTNLAASVFRYQPLVWTFGEILELAVSDIRRYIKKYLKHLPSKLMIRDIDICLNV